MLYLPVGDNRTLYSPLQVIQKENGTVAVEISPVLIVIQAIKVEVRPNFKNKGIQLGINIHISCGTCLLVTIEHSIPLSR